MKKLFYLFFCLCGLLMSTVSCKDDNDEEDVKPGNAVYSISNENPSVGNMGGTIKVKFVAIGSWSVSSSANNWCTISTSTKNGEAGAGEISIAVASNPGGNSRVADITIEVAGYEPVTLCKVSQSKSGGANNGNSVTHWMAEYMASHYLWNSGFMAIKDKLAYDDPYNEFLLSALGQIKGNDEDGYVGNDGNRVFFSYVMQYENPNKSQTRVQNMKTNYGVTFLYVSQLSTSTFSLIVGSVYPGSPAEKAGLTRGVYITKFNGANINSENLYEVYYTLMGYPPYYTGGNLTLKIAKPQETENPGEFLLADMGTISVGAKAYDANPILHSDIYESQDKSHKIGYFVYSEFDLYHDEDMVKEFAKFKSEGITDLVLDLRYNPGGYAYSSALMGTLIVGDQYKGQVFSRMAFNETRTANGEVEYFYIGKNPSMNDYNPIPDALSSALNLKTVYVLTTDNTASASELIINGLRGLDITVHTVGTTTQGKNVGMEVIMSNATAFSSFDFGNYVYEFAPITFYNFNAKDFNDFSKGFAPSYQLNESSYLLADFGDYNNDPLLGASVIHILSGSWPQTNSLTKSVSPISTLPRKGQLGGTLVFDKNCVETVSK